MKPRKRLTEIRKQRGYTQHEIAKKLGIPRSTYSGYEQGYSTPPLDRALKIKEVLKYNEDDIFFR